MTVPASIVDADRPWPGPIPFEESARDYFYGRDAAVDELIRLITRDVGVTLFGRSGLGKTSLLQAGVFPRLREATFLPVYIRLRFIHDDAAGGALPPQGADLRTQISETVPDLTVQVAQRLFRTMKEARIPFPQLSRGDDLWTYLHRSDFVEAALSQGAIPVFVFDQFEELFTRGMADPARQQECVELLDLLANLIQGRVPGTLRQRFEENPDQMAHLLLDQPSYRIVIALREDYLPFLEELSVRAPMFNRSRLRLLPMNRAEALLAVEQPGKAVLDADVARLIVSVLAGDDRDTTAAGEIDPSILSLFCHELNVRRIALGMPKINRSLVSDERDEILARFYERCFEGIPERVRDLVESELITDGGVLVEISLENAVKNSGGDRQPFETLAARRLVRFENRRGSTRLELVHDVLIDPLRKSAEQRAQRRALAAAEAARQDEARRRVVRLRSALFVSIGGLVLAGTLLLLLAWSMSSQQRARAQSQLVSCVMPMFVSGYRTGLDVSKEGLRGRDALLDVTSRIQTEVDCGAGLPLLMQRTGSRRRDTILWAIGLSTLPGSASNAGSNVGRIEAALNLNRTSDDEDNSNAGDADARLAQAEIWERAGNLDAAAGAVAKAIRLFDGSQSDGDTASQLRLADLLNREGELRTEARQFRRAEPLLRQSLAIRKRIIPAAASRGLADARQGRFLLAQSYAALGRLSLQENAAAHPAAFAMIDAPSAPTAALTRAGYHAYELCLSRGNLDGAGRGLRRDDETWKALASFCLNHRIKSLLSINNMLTKSSVSKLLSVASVDLNTIPETEKQKYYDVLQFMADYYRREYLANPSNDAARRLTGTYSRWLLKAKRDVFSQGPTPDRLRSLVVSLNDLSRYYQMTGHLKLATSTSARACLIASEDPAVYSVWGTALALAGREADAQTLYNRASRLFASTSSTRKSIAGQLANLRRAGTPSVDRVVAAMNRLEQAEGDRSLGRCDDGFQGEF